MPALPCESTVVGPTDHVHLIPVVLLAWLAWTIARISRRSGANELLAVFVAIVAAEFGLQHLARSFQPMSQQAADLTWELANLFGSMDPLILFAFAMARWSATCRPRRRPVPVVLMLAPMPFVVVALKLLSPTWNHYVGHLYVDGVYLASFALLLDAFFAERGPYLRREL